MKSKTERPTRRKGLPNRRPRINLSDILIQILVVRNDIAMCCVVKMDATHTHAGDFIKFAILNLI